MANNLKQYFPMIRSRAEVLGDINANQNLKAVFAGWDREHQEEFLDFCTGVRGVKLLYDCFFKQIMNPAATPERLEEFLSLLLNEKVKIIEVLPAESTNLADGGALLILDILVRFEDGRFCNVEIQKRGYAFPGQRSACYSADLIMRQYKAVRSKKKKKFSYKDIKDVFTVVLFDQSPSELKEFPDTYRHRFEQKSDTGLKLEHLQKYIYVPLDILRNIVQNNGISNKLEAWLVFLSMDEPEMIEKLITKYPEFIPMYEQAYDMCRDLEVLMDMFSKELRILDRNTVQYMIDDMQATIDTQAEQLKTRNKELQVRDEQLKNQKQQLEERDEQLNAKDKELNVRDEQLKNQRQQLQEKDERLSEKDKEIAELKRQLAEAGKK